MNNLKSYNSYNEGRFNFGKDDKEVSPNRDLLKKKRQEILQKLSAIKHEIAKNNAKAIKPVEHPTEVVDTEVEAEIVAEPHTQTTAQLNIQLESLRQELRSINKLLS